jgi:hypothetical protein
MADAVASRAVNPMNATPFCSPDPEPGSGATAAATHATPVHCTPRVFAAFSSPVGHSGFGSRNSIVHGDRTVGNVTSRAWLPRWPQTLRLGHPSVELPSLASFEIVSDGRRWPLLVRHTSWHSGSNEPAVAG